MSALESFGTASLANSKIGRAGGRLIDLILKAGWYGLLIAAALIVGWWQSVGPWVHLLVIVALVAGLVLVFDGRARGLLLGSAINRAQQQMRAGVHDGQPPHVLYHWNEPVDLAPGLLCRCGKPRRAGERIYDGETNRVERRHGADDDRLGACWFVPGIVGQMETFPNAALAKIAEREAIRRGTRENIAHAGARR